MKKRMPKLLAVLVVLLFAMQLVPFAALAEEAVTPPAATSEEPGTVPTGDLAATDDPGDAAEGSAAPGGASGAPAPTAAAPAAADDPPVQAAAASGFVDAAALSGGEQTRDDGPASTAGAAGYFFFAALSEGTLVAKPLRVDYAAGDTIATALARTEYTFAGLDTGDVTAVNGVAGGYGRACNEPVAGALDRLDATPEPLAGRLLVFKNSAEAFTVSTALAGLAEQMARYTLSEEARRYAVATNTYNGTVRDFGNLMGNDAMAGELAASLRAAIDAAEGQHEGTPVAVPVTLNHGDTELDADAASVTLTNLFGTTFTATSGQTLALLPGNYSFQASIPGLNKTAKGSFSVAPPAPEEGDEPDEPQRFKLTFPGDDYWLAAVSFGSSRSAVAATYNPVTGTDFSFSIIDTFTDLSAYTALNWSEQAAEFPSRSRSARISYVDTHYGSNWSPSVTGTDLAAPSTALNYFVPAGGKGMTAPYVVTLTDTETGIVFTQDYTVTLQRERTLKGLRVLEDGRALPLDPAFAAGTGDYVVEALSTTDTLEILPETFAGYDTGYRAYVDGRTAPEGEAVSVALKNKTADGADPIEVQVVHEDGTKSRVYSVTPVFVSPARYTLTVPEGATAEVRNTMGAVYPGTPVENEANTYAFDLAEGARYTYTVALDTYYETVSDFYAEDGGGETVTVDRGNYLGQVEIKTTAAGSDIYFQQAADGGLPHEMGGAVKDTVNSAWLTASFLEDMGDGREFQATYNQMSTGASANGPSRTVTLKGGVASQLSTCLATGGRGQTIQLVAVQTVKAGEAGGFDTFRRQIYNINLERELYLSASMKPSFSYHGTEAMYGPAFDANLRSGYEVFALETATELSVMLCQAATVYPEVDEAYAITVNGVAAQPAANFTGSTPWVQADIPLDPARERETVTVELSHPSGATGVYTFEVKKVKPMVMTVEHTPEDAVFTLRDKGGNRIKPDEAGGYNVLAGAQYDYVLSKTGYVAAAGTLTADSDNPHVVLALTPADPNENINPDMDVDWNKFRGEDNTGVTNRETPMKPGDAQVYWDFKTSGMSNTGLPIVLDDTVALTTGSKLHMLDSVSGKLIAEANMVGSGGLIPLYAEGMLFVSLSSGRIQAFNATPRPQTPEEILAGTYSSAEVMVLDSLWVYTDPLGSGSNTIPIYYADGYLYAAWERSNQVACVSITDEDPTQTHEAKHATWRHEREVGSNRWSGVHAGEKFVIVPSSANPRLTCLDVKTGEVLDTFSGTEQSPIRNEICSSIAYDAATDRYYFSSKNDFYSVGVDEEGKFYDYKAVEVGYCTSTPAVYNGRAYVGVSGVGAFTSYSGSGIVVIDLASMSVAYAINTRGTPQGSGLVSTAHLDAPHLNPQTGQMETGFVYVYFSENTSPGNLSYIVDKPGLTQPALTQMNDGVVTNPVLLVPKGVHAQYNLSSLVADKYGTMYMKVDGAYIMAIGQKITGLELVRDPDRTLYLAGDEFDLEGIQVLATYSNGTKRDVTKYLEVKDPTLTEGQISIDVIFPYALYNNETPPEYIPSNATRDFEGIPRPSVNVPVLVMSEGQADEVEKVIEAIDAIGEVVYPGSDRLIREARRLYTSLSPHLRPGVVNYDVFEEAQARYEMLQAAANNKLPASKAIDAGQLVLHQDPEGRALVTTPTRALLDLIPLNTLELMGLEAGEKLNIYIEAQVLEDVPLTERVLVNAVLTNQRLAATGYVLDIKLYKQVGDGQKTAIPTLLGNDGVLIDLPLPEQYVAPGRAFYVIRVHGSAVPLRDQFPESITQVRIRTNGFSTYALTYATAGSVEVDLAGGERTGTGDGDDRYRTRTEDPNSIRTLGNRTGGSTGGAGGAGGGVGALGGLDGLGDLGDLPDGGSADAGSGGGQQVIEEPQTPEAAPTDVAGGNLALILWVTGAVVVAIVAVVAVRAGMRRARGKK